MATVQVTVVAEEKRGADPFLALVFIMQNITEATILKIKHEKKTKCDTFKDNVKALLFIFRI